MIILIAFLFLCLGFGIILFIFSRQRRRQQRQDDVRNGLDRLERGETDFDRIPTFTRSAPTSCQQAPHSVCIKEIPSEAVPVNDAKILSENQDDSVIVDPENSSTPPERGFSTHGNPSLGSL